MHFKQNKHKPKTVMKETTQIKITQCVKSKLEQVRIMGKLTLVHSTRIQ